MKQSEFRQLEPIVDDIQDIIDEMINTGHFTEIQKLLTEAIAELPDSYSLSLNIDFSVFDNEREKEIKLLQTGLTTSEGEPYQHSADTTPLKYMVDGEMCIVPEEFCPNCWGEWQFKFKHTTCQECGYELGKQVKYLLDDDTCPYCLEGEVTINNPVCEHCGEKVDPQKVVWG
jgi:ribosomal protein L32